MKPYNKSGFIKIESSIKPYKHTNLILKHLITDYVLQDTLTVARLLFLPELIDAPAAYKNAHLRPISARVRKKTFPRFV